MEKAIAVVSGKGGAGKTTFTSNVGLALKRLGLDVTALDGDMSNPNLGLQLGFFRFPLGLQDVLDRGVSVQRAVCTHPSGLSVVPSSVSMRCIRGKQYQERLRRLVRGIRGVVLIDSPPGIGSDVRSIIKASDDVIVITNPELSAATDALKAVHVSRELGKEPLGIVLNRTGGKHELLPGEIEAMCGSRIIGSIPEDRNVRRSISSMNPVVHENPHSRSSVAFSEIAAGLSGVEYKRPGMLRVKRLLSIVRKGSCHDRPWMFPLIDDVRSEVHKEAPRPKRKRAGAESRRERAIMAVRNLRVEY